MMEAEEIRMGELEIDNVLTADFPGGILSLVGRVIIGTRHES
jgi:hypothetical protein